MDVETITYFLEAIGCRNIVASGDWVNASCPFARWRHAGGRDENPSFGISVGEVPSFNCFACSSSGSLIRLLHALQLMSGTRYSKAWKILIRHGVVDEERPDVPIVAQSPTEAKMRVRKPMVQVPPEVLGRLQELLRSESRERDEVVSWLVDQRGVSMQAIAQNRLRLYINRSVGVVFPIMSRDLVVYDMFVRMIDSKVFFRLSPSLVETDVQYSAPGLWFGNHLLDMTKPVMLVEGALDALKMHSLGFVNAVASMGTPSRKQLGSLYARCVYLGFDADEAGQRMQQRVANFLLHRIPYIYTIDWAVVGAKDPGEVRTKEQLHNALDAAELLMRPLRRIA